MSKVTSKFLSYILRHKPEDIGLVLDKAGWVSIDSLIQQCNNHGKMITVESLSQIVKNDSKQRYSYNENLTYIRANQGHSVEVDLGYHQSTPPDTLYHGTPANVVDIIMVEGLKKMNRHHVHLSADKSTAYEVGKRRGESVILLIDSGKMHQDGYKFYLSTNNVWLTDFVPVKYISS